MATVGGYSRRCGGSRNRRRERPTTPTSRSRPGRRRPSAACRSSDPDEAARLRPPGPAPPPRRAHPADRRTPSRGCWPRPPGACEGVDRGRRRQPDRRRRDELDAPPPVRRPTTWRRRRRPSPPCRPSSGAVRGRTGPVKLQLTGPVTLGRALVDAGAPADVAFAVAGSAVRERVETLLAAARHAVPSAPLLVFLDEPGLTGNEHPALPAGQRGGRPAPLRVAGFDRARRHQRGALLRADRLVAGHPGRAPGPVPARDGRRWSTHAGTLGRFLERDGWIAWGAVPTDEPVGETGDGLWRRLSDLWCGLVRGGLRRRPPAPSGPDHPRLRPGRPRRAPSRPPPSPGRRAGPAGAGPGHRRAPPGRRLKRRPLPSLVAGRF